VERRWIQFAVLFTGLISSSHLRAQTNSKVYDLPKVVAVQNRAYQIKNDWSFQVGYLPSDAFNKGITVGGSTTHFLTDYLGWEIVNANYSFNSPTRLKNDLLSCCEVDVRSSDVSRALDYVQWYALTNLIYTPLYTKALLFNRDIVRGEVSFVGGGGMAHFADMGKVPMASLGLYLRLFQGEENSWKFDFRNNVYFQKSIGAVNAISLMVGYSFHFGSHVAAGDEK
jgi:outer membrane beta-barrel protein